MNAHLVIERSARFESGQRGLRVVSFAPVAASVECKSTKISILKSPFGTEVFLLESIHGYQILFFFASNMSRKQGCYRKFNSGKYNHEQYEIICHRST
jgi:hypothetical protein